MFEVDLQTRIVRNVILGISAAFVAAAFFGEAHAGNQFRTLDIPGAGTSYRQGTFPTATNGTSVITGNFVDSNNVSHGFIGAVKGTMATFDAPGAGTFSYQGTSPTAINSSSIVTGFYIDVDDHRHGFVRSSGGTFETFSIDATTIPVAISNRGAITGRTSPVGFVSTPDGSMPPTSTPWAGFVRTADGGVAQFSVPGAYSTTPLAINGAGVVTGEYQDFSLILHGFVRSRNGTIIAFDVPGDFSITEPTSINNNGDITGSVYNFVSRRNDGFVRTSDGTISTFSPSGCDQITWPTSINFAGVIVGQCDGADFVFRGFTRWPDGAVALQVAPLAGTANGTGTFPTAIGPNGKTVGHAQDDNGVNHGYRLNVIAEPPAHIQ